MPAEAKCRIEGHVAKGDKHPSFPFPPFQCTVLFGLSHERHVLPTDLLYDKARMSHYFGNHCSARNGEGRAEEIACADKMEN